MNQKNEGLRLVQGTGASNKFELNNPTIHILSFYIISRPWISILSASLSLGAGPGETLDAPSLLPPLRTTNDHKLPLSSEPSNVCLVFLTVGAELRCRAARSWPGPGASCQWLGNEMNIICTYHGWHDDWGRCHSDDDGSLVTQCPQHTELFAWAPIDVKLIDHQRHVGLVVDHLHLPVSLGRGGKLRHTREPCVRSVGFVNPVCTFVDGLVHVSIDSGHQS